MREIVIATRPSRLARAQTALVIAGLRRHYPNAGFRERIVRSDGDADQQTDLARMGGSGVFTRAVQQVVLVGDADLAVHSLKDLPTQPTPGLHLVAIPPRGPAADVLVGAANLTDLPPGARVGTGSPRRAAQLRLGCAGVRVLPCRGNVDTRLKKLVAGDYDALVLAQAGLERLGLAARIGAVLDDWYYAPGQGALAVEARVGDAAAAVLDDPETRAAVTAERVFIAALGAGCHAAVGVRWQGHCLEGMVAGPEGEPFLTGADDDPVRLADNLLAQGAGEVLA